MPCSLALSAFPLGFSSALFCLVAGVFFGDYTVVLEPVGTLYIMLLESTVSPYIVCSLIHGLGALDRVRGFFPNEKCTVACSARNGSKGWPER